MVIRENPRWEKFSDCYLPLTINEANAPYRIEVLQ